MKKTALTVAACAATFALTVASAPASAANVTVYGTIDMGLSVTHANGSTSAEMKSGMRNSSRVGLKVLAKRTHLYVDAGYFEQREKKGALTETTSGSEVLAGMVHYF